jgi:dihydroflavonol-4-reductase
MLIFVTGGNGFVGSRVVHELIEQGHQVRALLRPTSSTKRIAHLTYEKLQGDILDEAALLQGMNGCDGVIHLASLSNWNEINSPKMPEVVIEGSKKVFAAAQKQGNIKVVYVSSSTAINGTDLPVVQNEKARFELGKKFSYALAKNKVEEIATELASQGQKIIIVNPAEVYGPHDDQEITCGNLKDFAKSNPIFVCSGGTSVVHVDDVAKGIVAALEKGRVGERYFLGGENLTIKELASLTVSLLHKRKTILNVNNKLLRLAANVGKRLKIPLPFNPHVIPYATKYWFFENHKAKEELGISFRSAEETLRDALAWMEKVGKI